MVLLAKILGVYIDNLHKGVGKKCRGGWFFFFSKPCYNGSP